MDDHSITEVTRRSIFDYLRGGRVSWSGRLDEIDFLARIWNLDAMPSEDSRCSTALQDIAIHREQFKDWGDDWIYSDPRFNITNGGDVQFLEFLCEMVHPAVRSDRDEVDRLVRFFNGELAADGWLLAPTHHISRRPVYEPRRLTGARPARTALPLEEYRLLQDPEALEEHLRRIEAGLQSDPARAIGSSKELVETVCRVILDACSVESRAADDLMDLYKKTSAALRLNAEAVPESAKGSQAAQGVLRALVTVVQRLAELRNELGVGHGRAHRSIAETRHGQLAFDAAATVVRFLLSTWHTR